MWLGNAFISKCMWRKFNYYPTMSSSCIWPEQQAGSHSIWPCLWRHKWIITTPSNELETIKGSWGHIISIWSGYCRGSHVSRQSADLGSFTQGTVCNWCDFVAMGTDAILPHNVTHKGHIPVGLNDGIRIRGLRKIEGNWNCFIFTASWTYPKLLQVRPFIANVVCSFANWMVGEIILWS